MPILWETRKLLPLAIGTGIDMGCGHDKIGSFGIDLSNDSDADLVCDFAHVPLPSESQSYIIARHSLEHHSDTILVLTEWRRLLKKGGTLGIIVPNGDVPLHAILGCSTDDHRQLFTATTLGKFLEYCRFRVSRCASRGRSLFFHAVKP
jgi:SAM-dependent methyltransferase